VITSTAGGVAAVAGGGKFGNGALTAAFGYLFNAEAGRAIGRAIGGWIGGAYFTAQDGPLATMAGILWGSEVGGQFGSDIEDWAFPKPKAFAMGLDRYLDAFAAERGATTWKDFDDPVNWKYGVTDKLSDPKTTIHFNLDDVDVGVAFHVLPQDVAAQLIGNSYRFDKTLNGGVGSIFGTRVSQLRTRLLTRINNVTNKRTAVPTLGIPCQPWIAFDTQSRWTGCWD